MIRPLLCLFTAAVTLTAATPLFEGHAENAWSALRGSAAPDSVTHNGNKSLRLEKSGADPNAAAQSKPIHLTIGKTYELSGWVKTSGLEVKDTDLSPIATGAVLTMASMPYDVHSESVGGTHDWTRLSLRFVASRAEDNIVLSAGNGGSLKGSAWFEGVSIDEVSPAQSWPARDAIRTFGPAYRYPAAGWVYLHIEGKPYDRGYQHGYLMAKEIPEYLARCAVYLSGKNDLQAWNAYRTSADALFLRGFDREILEEMKGIVDGANEGGARWFGRKLDLIDIVLANTSVEMNELASAMRMTPSGLEGTKFDLPPYAPHHDSPLEHCSAFAATGPATKDGKMIIGHVTWWPQSLSEQTNVMLDIKPEKGHRLLMQSYPGGIESGTDWYQNDAGIILTETTIRQTPFNAQGTPVAFRARMAIQYAANIDEVVAQLGTRNNGLYTNEWLMGDAKNDEIAMYELGTSHTKLWRSSKNEWFGNTPGFYWGNNNAKDLAVKLEYLPDPQGAPEYVPFVPAVRDLAWMDLYKKNKGQIDEQFAFKAFDSAPLVAATTMDAKVTNSALASRMMVWGEFGRPNETVLASRDTNNHGLYPGGYYLFNANPTDDLSASIAANEKARMAPEKKDNARKPAPVTFAADKLWKGWILPASDADTWFAAGTAAYHRILQSRDVDQAMEAERIRYRGLKLAAAAPDVQYRLQETGGVLLLDSLRRKMGDDAFLKTIDGFFAASTTKTVTAQAFLDAAHATYAVPDPGEGAAYLPADINSRLATAVIVYGTTREAGTNRYAAEQMQIRFRERSQREVAVYKDFEAPADVLARRDVIFIGRPETNSALAAWASKLGLDYSGAIFKLDGKTYASERNSLIMAAKNPMDASHMVVVYAGNSPLETARAASGIMGGDSVAQALEDGKSEEPVAGAFGGARRARAN